MLIEQWRSAFDNCPIGFVLMDANGGVLATNAAYQKMLGYSESELEQISLLEVTHEQYRERNLALFTELQEGKRDQYQIEKQYWRKDGTLVWVRNSVWAVRDTENTIRFVLALSEDITERKRAEATLAPRDLP
jgi:PAS domain S-box-containing protein